MGSMTATTEPTGLPRRPLTVADLEGMPDDGHRYELLDGVLIVSPAPAMGHQLAVGRLFALFEAVAPPGLAVLPAPFAVRPQGREPLYRQQTELQPDVVVAPSADFTDRELPGAPLIAVEVLSPSTRLMDLNLKRAAYERMGTPSYWVVDPDAPSVRVFEADAGGAYRQVAEAVGEALLELDRPFAVRLRPADLVAPRR